MKTEKDFFMKNEALQATAELTLFDGLAACSRTRQLFYVLLPCPDALRRVLSGQIERLFGETGKLVHVTFIKVGANGGAQ